MLQKCSLLLIYIHTLQKQWCRWVLSVLINASLIVAPLTRNAYSNICHIHMSKQKVISNFINRSNWAEETNLTQQHVHFPQKLQSECSLWTECRFPLTCTTRQQLCCFHRLCSLWQHIEKAFPLCPTDWMWVFSCRLLEAPESSTRLFFILTIPFRARQITELWLQAWLGVLICYHYRCIYSVASGACECLCACVPSDASPLFACV